MSTFLGRFLVVLYYIERTHTSFHQAFDRLYNPTQKSVFERLGGVNLHLNNFEHKGMTFTGFDGNMGYVFAENLAAYPKECDMDKMNEELISLGSQSPADVFITHYPSLNTLDHPEFLGHKGLKAFRDYIDRVKPKYHFHGHIHDPQTAKIGETKVYRVFPELVIDI